MSTVSQVAPPDRVVRRRLVVRGVVQGVGFRPHLARLASDLGLDGGCHNDATSVEVEVEGPAGIVATFEARLVDEAPPLARIESVAGHSVRPLKAVGAGFVIGGSTAGAGQRTMVPPDTSPCAQCLAELADPADRRYRHPFITCTHCGPRLTITADLPYDRAQTTMAGFAMCAACAAEYADPLDRRYHAQPIACHDCGPVLRLVSPDGAAVAAGTEPVLSAAIDALRAGGIVAVKGLGGYHLACDASNPRAVAELRARKHRPDQPFAVMARDLATAGRLAEVAGAGPTLLAPARPIVLLAARPEAPVAAEVAPGLGELGVMLPYTPLHHLLFADRPDGSPGAPPVLVMTSGNVSGEPLCYTDDDALARLGGIADLFLTHDRPVAVPVEDSVIAWSAEAVVPIRRSRGYAPLPVDLTPDAPGSPPGGEVVVLAAGAELKNTVALVRAGRAFVSAHVGDLESMASRDAHQRVTDQLLGFHRSRPGLLVADLHPGYASRAWARRLAEETGVPLLEVQHHHAHLASLAAEHGRLDEPMLGLVYDGTGYGCDATIWGGELLLLGDHGRAADRLGHLGAVRLPGGDAGVRNPVRTAALALRDAGVELAGTALASRLTAAEAGFLERAHRSGLGAVATSSVGRLFDVVSALLDIRDRISYEAQAAIELEATARAWRRTGGAAGDLLPFPVVAGPGPARLDPGPLVRALATAYADGVPAGALAWAFHESLAAASAEMAAIAAAKTGVTTVGLSGGVFVNRLLLTATVTRLRERGLAPLIHERVPANDGGLALGQAAVGHRHLVHPAN